MSSSLLMLLLPILGVMYAHAKTGEEIADAIYQHPNECKDPPDGGIWAPLQGENPACGAGPCNYPQQWCSATSDPQSSQNKPSLNCVSLPAECQTVLTSEATTAAATAASTAAPTTVATTAATQARTAATTRATSATGAPTAAPGGGTSGTSGTSASGCKDNHEYCCFWAARQQCDANPGWMRTNCQSSCGTCGCQAANFQTCTVKVNTAGCKWLNGGGQQGGNRVRVVLGGGPGLAAMGFGNPAGTGSGVGSVGMPGLSPTNGTGGTTGTAGTNSGRSPTMVSIPVGRKRRHFMPRWFNM